jgi:hypothetical protein
MITGQSWSDRRNMTRVHIQVLASRRGRCGIVIGNGALGRSGRDRNSMPTFEDREKEFEARFKHDEELRFKITARRNRLLGLWAAARMGVAGEASEAYAKEVVAAEFERGGDRHVIDKVVADLAAKGQAATADQVRFELEHLTAEARQQVMQE